MLLRMIYDDKLAQAAYLIGCQKTGEAIIVDPQRDVDRYLDIANGEGLRITAITETHIHADYLSGSRQMAEVTGAKLYLSGEGGPDWLYGFLDAKTGGGSYDHVLVHHNDTFSVGDIEFRVLHTPGHTPEHICFLVTDRGGGADEPMGILTGDFLFVGDLGRPDLLETAAGQVGMREPSARKLHESLEILDELPDYLQVWPAHGSGSACGKALGGVPQSTVGYEKRFNASLAAGREGQQSFVDFILTGQPSPPMYFARMKRLNRDGPPVLSGLPAPRELSASELAAVDTGAMAVVDTRLWKEFRVRHLAGSISTPLNQGLPGYVGSSADPEGELVLIIAGERLDEVVRDLVRIGHDHVVAWAAPETLEAALNDGAASAVVDETDVEALTSIIQSGDAELLDVRSDQEFSQGHIPGAAHIPHTRLIERLDELPRYKRIVVNCQGGGRSARACAFLQNRGFNVSNLTGGYQAWQAAGGAVITEPTSQPTNA